MKNLFYLLASCALLLLVSPIITSAATADEAIGSVVAVRGQVTAVAASGAQRQLYLKSPVFQKDTIRTENGRVQLMFSDNTLISLGRESEMVLSEYDWQPDGKSGAMKTRIKEGTFRVMGGAITKVAPDNFTTETPVATIGIRGSMYAGKVSPETLMVVFQGGKGIDVFNAAGSVAITKTGFGTRVGGLNQPPLSPVKFTEQELSELNADPSSDGEGEEQNDTAVQQEDSKSDEDQQADEDEKKDDDQAAKENDSEETDEDQTAKSSDQQSSDEQSDPEDSGDGETPTTTNVENEDGEASANINAESGSGEFLPSSEQQGTPLETLQYLYVEETSETAASTDTQLTDLNTEVGVIVTDIVNQTIKEQLTETDTDGDGIPDSLDAFPIDSTESVDSDGDGVGDNSDPFPNDPNYSTTLDSDGDGVADHIDAFPNDSTESVDSDGDGVGDNADAFPNDPNYSTILDSDGDGVADHIDAFPNDSTETADSDGDGIGDNSDASGRLLGHLESYDSTTASSATSHESYAIDGKLNNGSFEATFTDSANVTSTLIIDLPGADSSAPYNEVFWEPYNREVNGEPLDWGDVFYDSQGEFLIFWGERYNFENFDFSFIEEDYQEYGYAGIRASSLPTTSIAVYTGPLQFVPSEAVSSLVYHDSSMHMWVNFENGTALGFAEGGNHEDEYSDGGLFDGGLFYGKILGNELTNIHFIGVGNDSTTSSDIFHELTGETGTFFGSAHQGFGWGGTGASVLTAFGDPFGSFELLSAGYRGTEVLPADMTDQQWKGYLAGMTSSDPTAPPLLLHNGTGSADDLQININAAAGNVGGAFSLNEGNPLWGTAAVPFGADASLASAYIDTSWFFAALPNGSTTSQPMGGVLAPASPWEQWSDYFTWGWWGLFYNDGSTYYTTYEWDNFWVAGNLTSDLSPTILNDTLGTAVTGTYYGQAHAFLYDGSQSTFSQYQELVGRAELLVDFQSYSFTGLLDFSFQSGPSLSYGGSVTSNGIQATALTIDGTSSQTDTFFLNGNFFGAGMEALAGNFSAELSTSSFIAGIFGGEDSPPQAVPVSGNYLSLITDYDILNYNEEIWSGEISAQVEDGLVSGNANTLASDGTTSKSFPMSFFSSEKSPTPAETGAVSGWPYSWDSDWQRSGFNSAHREVDLMGADQIFEQVDYKSFDPSEFNYFIQQDRYFGTYPNDGYFSEMGYMGSPAASIVAQGVEYFWGDSLQAGYTNNDLNSLFTQSGLWAMGVNWDNGKAVGIARFDSYSNHGGILVFFGDVDTTNGQLTGVNVVGSSLLSDPDGFDSPFGIDGSTATFAGQFYGSSHQGFGATAEGDFQDLSTSTLPVQAQWEIVAAGFKGKDFYSFPEPATGTATWEGFAIGLAEDVQNPDLNRQIFVSDSPAGFTLTINRDTGLIDGSLTATSVDESTTITDMKIGGDSTDPGAYPSAYVESNLLVAALGCAAGSTGCITNAAGEAVLEPAGSYLVADRHSEADEYASWGYWETAYVEPGTGKHFHVHQPGSMWVAGEKTPGSYIQSLIDTSITGTYSGSAQAYRIDALNSYNNSVLYGRTDLTVDFGLSTITGGFDFAAADNYNLPANVHLELATSGQIFDVSTSSFSAQIVGAAASQVSGAFFGPEANAVGGVFHADIAGDGTYMGAFGANLNAPALQ